MEFWEEVKFKARIMREMIQARRSEGKSKGFIGSLVLSVVGIFIVAIIGIYLLPSYANAAAATAANNNVTAAPGGQIMVQITTTLFALVIVGIFFGGVYFARQ